MEIHVKVLNCLNGLKLFYRKSKIKTEYIDKRIINIMIDKKNFHYFNYIKKEEFSGSIEGMRYMLKKVHAGDEEKLQVTIWQGPLNYIKTPEEKKKVTELPFSAEGVEMAADWLNEQYEADKTEWEKGKRLL